MKIVDVVNADGTIETYECTEAFITGIGYMCVFEDDSRMIISPSMVNKIKIRNKT